MAIKKLTLIMLTSLYGLSACTGGVDTSSSTSSSTPTGASSSAANSSSSQDVPNPSSSTATSSSSESQTATAQLSISEIVAKSDDDTYLDGNDWIELYNGGSSVAHLGDYALADSGSDIIPLPAISIAPGEYTVIAAMDSEEENPPTLSVPFKLGKSDDITLYFQGNAVDALAWEEGQADEGFSYGRLDRSSQILQPTPGAANVLAEISEPIARGNPTGSSALRISEVVPKSDRPTFYEGSDWVELHNTGSSAINLRDFSLADDSSELEALPDISLAANERVVITAGNDTAFDGAANVTFGLGREDSLSLFVGDEEVDYLAWSDEQSKNGRSYGYLGGQLQTLYPTPNEANIAYVLFTDDEVFDVHVDIAPEDWQAILAAPTDEAYYPANFSMNGAKIDNVAFRVKGQGSLMSIRNSIRYGFKVDTNRYVDQKFMGMKKIVFNQSFADPSYMRDTIAYRLMAKAGVPAPQVSYVNLWVGDDHMGLYQMIEMIDDEFLEKHFPEDQDEIGDLYKGELGQRLTWVDGNIDSYSEGLRLKTNEETIGTEQEGAALLAFLDGINNGSDPLAHINVDLTIKYLAASVLLGNMDSPIGGTANNFYLYEQRSEGKFTLIPWDYNLSMGLWGDGPAVSIGGGFGGGGFGDNTANPDCRIVDHVLDNPVHDTNSERPIFDAILANPALREQYHAEVQHLIDTAFNEDSLRAEMTQIENLIDDYVMQDPTKFYTYQEWQMALDQGLPDDSNNQDGRGAGIYGPDPGVLNFVRERTSNVQQQLNGTLPISNNGDGTACPTPM